MLAMILKGSLITLINIVSLFLFRCSNPRDKPPWMIGQRKDERALLDAWCSSEKLRERFISEFIHDALFLDISGLASAASTVSRKRINGRTISHHEHLNW
jgi:hypothetical protein